MSQESPTVLVVGDDAAFLCALTAPLQAAGYLVRIARDSQEAQAAIMAERPHFLVIHGPAQDEQGLAICRWVRTSVLSHYLYTILLAPGRDSDEVVRGLEAGADDVLRSPLRANELLARLKAGKRIVDLESRLSQLAKRDSLTGLLTQRTFYELLQKEWERLAQDRIPASCVMVDIDFFKRINDTYGHAVGDEVIRRVAKILETHTTCADVVSRYGGEEFCVLLRETGESQAVAWAERIRKVLSEEPVLVGETRVHITASFGIAPRLSDIDDPQDLVDQADQALLIAKRVGRDQVTSFRSISECPHLKTVKNQPTAFEGLLARDVMTTIVAGLPQREKVGRAVEYFLQLRIHSAPVVDDEGRLVGVLAEKDAMAILLLPRWWEATIADVMKRNVISYDEDAPAQLVYEFLCRVAVRSVVVVKDGRPTGILSRASLLRWFTNALIAKGEAGGLENASFFPGTPERPEEQLAALAAKLCEEAERLERGLAMEVEDLKPRLVGGASRMQELLNDLLGYSQLVEDAPPPRRNTGRSTDEIIGGLHTYLARAGADV